jgi:hypothetical protein
MKKNVQNTILCIFSFLISFFIAELVFRYINHQPLFSTTNYVNQTLDIIHTNSSVMVHDELLGWRLKENLKLGTPDNSFTMGEYGLRMVNNEIKAIVQGSILATGDSFTIGSGVPDSGSWPAHLEKLIGKPILNAGAGAWGVDQMILRAEQLIPIVKPQTLIVGILAQDSLRNCFEVYGGGYKPYFNIVDNSLVLKGVPVPKVSDKPLTLGFWQSIFGYSYMIHSSFMHLGYQKFWIKDKRRYVKAHDDKGGIEISKLLMKRLQQLSQKTGIRVIVVMLWGAQESMANEPAWYGSAVVDAAKKDGMEILDMYPLLHRYSQEKPEEFKNLWQNEGGVLGHMSVKGNLLVAENLAQTFFKNK